MPSPETTKPLTETQRIALADCATFTFYFWKQKTMEKLAGLGLVERVASQDRAGQLAYKITDAGKDYLLGAP